MTFVSHSCEQTREFGASVARRAHPGDVYALEGALGTGKTEFARGFIRALTGEDTTVRSPTFSILNIYITERFPIYHFDFYRIAEVSELSEIGFDEYVRGDGVCLIEWGTMFPEALPANAAVISFFDDGDEVRRMEYPGTIKCDCGFPASSGP